MPKTRAKTRKIDRRTLRKERFHNLGKKSWDKRRGKKLEDCDSSITVDVPLPVEHINTEEPVPPEQEYSVRSGTDNVKPTPGEPDSTFRLDTPCKSNHVDAKSNCIVVAETAQLVKFVEQFAICPETNCAGKLKVLWIELTGLGGAASLSICCTSCGSRNVKFETSSMMENGGAAVSKILQVATICSGTSYAIYKKQFHHILGMSTVSDSVFFETIRQMYKHVKDILDGICLEARKEMQDMDQKKLGSWKRAVTCGDAVWLTRGSFSRNCTYTVRNYLTGALLYYYHICQKGSDNLCQDELYEGTSKAAEGFGANKVFKLMVEDQMNVECHIQDGDSTSENVVLKHFPLCRVLRCGNHVAKNHAIKLDKLRKLKQMTTDDGVEVECCCKGKRHAKHCGCLTEKFIRKAKASFQMCLMNAGTDPNAFSEGLMNLALHHFQDEHQWDGGQCDFHPLVVCSCGSCTDQYDLRCHGKPYKTDHVLKCPFHTLAYKLECQEKAGLADVLIHPEMGKVTTNPVEASHNVLVRYRSKNWNLARLHYHVSTNIGLIQGCMTYLFTKRGPQYHWILDILERMCLPVVWNLPSILEKLNEDRYFDTQSKKTDVAKAKRKLYKRKRKVFEHQRRKLFVKESAMIHDYGGDDSTKEVIADASTDKCKCGSTEHRRTSHKSCPLRRTCDSATEIDTSCDINASKSDDNVSEFDDDNYDFESSLSDEMFVQSCACPNFPHHKWDCPDNVRNRKRAMDSSLTPAGALWTPPLKKMGLHSPKVPSPLVVSKIKHQSTPAFGSVFVPCNAEKVGSPTVSTPSFILGKKCEISVSKCRSPSSTPVLTQIPQQSTPVVHISHTVSTRHKAGSICTPASIDNMPEVHVSLSKCPSPLMTPSPSKLKKRSSHLAVAETAGSPSVRTPILLLNKKCDSSVPRCLLTPVSSKSTPTSIHKMREVQISLCPSPSMTLSPSKLKEQSVHIAVAKEVGCPSVCTPSLFQNKKFELSVPRCLLTPVPFKMKDHTTTRVDCVTVPHSDFAGQKVVTKSFHSPESDCFIDEEKTKGASQVLHEMLPPPSTNRDWVQKAVAIISKLSGIAVIQRVDAVKQVSCREIAPHIRDKIVGDGACFYRTISKAITGTEDNHFAVRMSLINFMLDPANVLAFGRLIRAGIHYDIDALKAVRSHINRHKLYLGTSWSTEYEVFAAATMFQVKIMVFTEYSNYRDWHTYVPRFTNETCMTSMKVMLYLYHINSNHYDLVIPVLD